MRSAGTLWLLAGLTYLASETIAASAFAGYSYAANYVSDLGVPYPVAAGSGQSLSRLAWVMNFGGFILDGLLYAAAAIIALRGCRADRKRATVFAAFAAVHSLGTILVGSIHSGPREIAAGIHAYHVIGAAMAIAGGNAASIAASRLAARAGAPLAYRRVSLGLGLFGFLGLAMLETNRVVGAALLPDGIFERAGVYPITAWEIVTGLTILIASPRR